MAEAVIQRELWTERDPRVPPQRRIDANGRPTVEDLEEWARSSGYTRLWATVRVWNTASRRVLAKVGFVETGRVEQDETHGDNLFTTKLL